MQINNSTGKSLAFNLEKNQNEMAKIQEKLATGKKLNRASDDAASMSMAKELEKQVQANHVAANNIDDGMSAINIADGASSNISDILQRQSDLSLQAANGTLNNDQRSILDNEFQSLSQEIDRITKNTQYNGQNLLDGGSALSNGQGHIQVGGSDSASDKINTSSSDISLAALQTGGLNISTANGASSALSTLDQARNLVTQNRVQGGSLYNRLGFAQKNSQNQEINTTAALSRIQDTDYAKSLTDQVSANLISATATSALHQYTQVTQSHLISLLQS